ncbi:MAG TPA: inorganic phosphate transporter [Candidatus Baltobacteraceae bacterium]|nr:inorganic phosphate transporter [Candidatus Baltobacteraceae bacterium]
MTVALIVVSLAFAWSMGAHYTGAVMGMPFAIHAISDRWALIAIAIFCVLGATFASEPVQRTVGLHIVHAARVTPLMALVMVLGAFILTTVYTYFKIPTSTIQILVFCVVGTGIAAGVPVTWATIGRLAITWVLAPIAAALLAYAGTTLLHRRAIPSWGLVAVGIAASFVLGANDVANAVGVWSMLHIGNLMLAGFAGGAAMGIGALTWGRRVLQRVAFEIVDLDNSTATAAQGVQAAVVIAAVTQGFFTSMNQALIGAMSGAAAANRRRINRKNLIGIVEGWVISPVSGFAFCFIVYQFALLLGAR